MTQNNNPLNIYIFIFKIVPKHEQVGIQFPSNGILHRKIPELPMGCRHDIFNLLTSIPSSLKWGASTR